MSCSMLTTSTTPENVGLDSHRLNRIATNIVDKFVQEGALPFGHVLVARKGKICYQYKNGHVDVRKKIPVKDDSMYRIYSMTKPLTSVTLMTLHEEGMFHMTDPLSRYLPEFAKENLRVFKGNLTQSSTGEYKYDTIPCTQDITIQMLMTHMSGLSYGFDRGGLVNPVDKLYHEFDVGTSGSRQGREDVPLDEFVVRLSKLPLMCQPGTQWNYSLSVDVQGRLVEVLTGQTLYEAMKQRLFDPLNMVDTHFHLPREKLSRMACTYIPNPFSKADVAVMKANQKAGKELPSSSGPLGNLIPPKHLLAVAMSGGLLDLSGPTNHRYVKGLHGVSADARYYESGGGGTVSTMHDYYQFAAMLANGGMGLTGKRILSRKTLQFMTVNHLPNNLDLGILSAPQYSEVGTPRGSGFGLGFSVVTDPTRQGSATSVGTFGWGGAAATYFWVDPKEELVVIWMTQLLGNGRQSSDSKYAGVGVPMRNMLKAIIYGAVVDKDMTTDQTWYSGTPELPPLSHL